tara:strand:- start:4118 stop:4630 length:513 start_codon:yes stop_codon:yes gene_type:complete
MNPIFYTALIVSAALILLFLSGYAFFLYLEVRKKKFQQKKSAIVLSEELVKRQIGYRNGIRVIASALIQGQVGLTEAAIRISKLSSLLHPLDNSDSYQVFNQLAQATSHIPILENWRQLSRQEQINFDKQRAPIEDNFRDFILSSAQKILDLQSNKSDEESPIFYSAGKE